MTTRTTPSDKPVPGFPHYLAAQDGQVFIVRNGLMRCLKQHKDRDGYSRVTMIDEDGKRHTMRVHHVIALAFLPARPSAAHEMRHKDGVREHNCVTNLCWGTRQENVNDRRDHGRTARGERSGKAKLTNAQVIAIRAALKGGGTCGAIARAYGMSRDCIRKIETRKTWTHI